MAIRAPDGANKKATKITDINAFTQFLFEQKKSQFLHFYCVKFFGPEIRSCKFFDKSQVCFGLEQLLSRQA